MFPDLILIIDGYAKMSELIERHLKSAGFNTLALSSVELLTDDIAKRVSAALLDFDTAGEYLRETINRLKGRGAAAIVMISEDNVEERLYALSLGAVDVIGRPFNLTELEVRIRAAKSRLNVGVPTVNRPVAVFEGIKVDLVSYSAQLDGKELSLQPKQLVLLYLLISSPGRVFSREEISRQLSGKCGGKTINFYISEIKKQIGRYAGRIVAVRSVGYKFIK